MTTEEKNQKFPSGLEAIFVIVGVFIAEYLVAAALRDARATTALHPRGLDGVIVLLGNGIVFIGMMHYKRLSYRSLFHSSKNSVAATISTLLVPILLVVPALFLGLTGVLTMLVWFVPLSWREAAMFEHMMSNGLASIVTVCILAPVLEEMLFRGLILRSFLNQYSRARAILGSAILFGFAHMNIYQFVVALVLGTIFGWLYERTRSLWPGILLHAVYNSCVMIVQPPGDKNEADFWDLSLVVWILAFMFAMIGAGLLKRILEPGPESKVEAKSR